MPPIPERQPRTAEHVSRGALLVVGGHSRGVGKTTLVERLLGDRCGETWIAVKISAHRHAPEGASAPLIEEARGPDPQSQTGRYLVAGARRAFLVRAPDAAMAQAAAFIERLRAGGSNVIVESNRIVQYVTPDALIFVIDPRIADWKPSSDACLAAADAVVYATRSGLRLPPLPHDARPPAPPRYVHPAIFF
jgi:hypothetical protein